MRNLSRICTLLLMTLATTAHADQVINDDLIVSGNACLGLDCTNGEAFTTDVLRIKENNTRVLFIDSSAGDTLGKTWIMQANGSNNGGRAFFALEARSPDKDTVLFSDGSYPEYDCTDAITPGACTIIGSLALGETALIPVQTTPGVVELQTVEWYSVARGFEQSGTAINSTALGAGSEPVDDAVSVGKTGLVRRLKHVAMALAATDVATLENLAVITDQLDTIDAQLDAIEDTVFALENPPPASSSDGLFSVSPGALLLFAVICALRIARSSRPAREQRAS